MSYTRDNPSPRYQTLMTQYRDMHTHGDRINDIPPEKTFNGISVVEHLTAVRGIIDRVGARTLLDYGCGKAEAYDKLTVNMPNGAKVKGLKAAWGLESVALYDPAFEKYSARPTGIYDVVISTDVLEHCPEEDIEWIVSDMFSFSRKALFCSIALYVARKHLPSGENAHVTLKSAGWWVDVFEALKARSPDRKYFLAIARTSKNWMFVEG